MSKVSLFEDQVKDLFVDRPGQMRLLIVADNGVGNSDVRRAGDQRPTLRGTAG